MHDIDPSCFTHSVSSLVHAAPIPAGRAALLERTAHIDAAAMPLAYHLTRGADAPAISKGDSSLQTRSEGDIISLSSPTYNADLPAIGQPSAVLEARGRSWYTLKALFGKNEASVLDIQQVLARQDDRLHRAEGKVSQYKAKQMIALRASGRAKRRLAASRTFWKLPAAPYWVMQRLTAEFRRSTASGHARSAEKKHESEKMALEKLKAANDA